MSDIIDFKNKNPVNNQSDTASTKEFFDLVSSEVPSVTGIFLVAKDTNSNLIMYYDNIDIMEKSFIIQMLQHDIYEEIAPTQEVEFEPDL